MARRKTPTDMDAKFARDKIGAYFRALASRVGGVNLAEFEAQLNEQRMVQMLVGFAGDPFLKPEFRRTCAKDVLEIARGPVIAWMHDGQTIVPDGRTGTGHTNREAVNEATLAAFVHEQISDLMMRRVPVALWPESVRAQAGELLARLEEAESTDPKLIDGHAEG